MMLTDPTKGIIMTAMENKQWIVTIEEDPDNGDLLLPFPPDMLEQVGWKEGDVINWKEENGSWILTRKSSAT